MIRTTFGAAVVAAVVFTFGAADAAKMRIGIGGCSGANQQKVEAMVEGMADGPNRFMGEEEIARAQDDLLNGRMAGCALHLRRASYDAVTPGPVSPSMQPAPAPAPRQPLKPAL